MWSTFQITANIRQGSRIYSVTAMAFIVAVQFQKERVWRIMMLSQLMSDCKQIDTRKFSAGMVHAGVNLLAAQSERSDFQHPFAGNSGSRGLLRELFSIEQGPYPLRT